MNDIPSIVYKYRNWDDVNHKRMLFNNELYLASPQYFNDPFDRGIPEDYTLLKTDKEKYNYVFTLTNKLKDSLKDRGLTFDEALKIGLDKISDTTKFQKNAIKESIRYHSDFWGVLSLSGIWDNILMWSHYGNNHKGFCVGFDEEKLRLSGLFGSGGNVMYTDIYPSIHPGDELFALESTHVKAKDWEYEKEYRLTKIFYPTVTPDDRIVTIDNSFFKEIILGCEFPQNQINEIMNECMNKNIPLYQATQVPMSFKLERHALYFV